jgi:hypothetical protein
MWVSKTLSGLVILSLYTKFLISSPVIATTVETLITNQLTIRVVFHDRINYAFKLYPLKCALINSFQSK